MIDIQVIASSSSGNCYVIHDGDNRIMIDPGIPIKKIRRACEFNLTLLDFCLVSHEHADHSKAVKNLMKIGTTVAMSEGSIKHFDANGYYVLLKSEQQWVYKKWKILPFSTEHDAEEPLGFLIETPSGEKIVYAIDTCYVSFRFTGVNYYMIEANYRESMLMQNLSISDSIKSRIRSSHFEIENVKKFFKLQDLSRVKAIYLLHLSNENANREEFIKEIQGVTGKPVY